MGTVSKTYLIIYNFLLTVGWTYVLYLTILNQFDYKTIWIIVRVPLQICQTAALLEILHSAIGLVRSSVIFTASQILARVFVVWAVLEISPPATTTIAILFVLYSWCITEIFRYGYYFLNLIGFSHLIVWFRYSLFIVLYPVGALAELICIYNSLGYIKENGIWRFTMDNPINFTFEYQNVLIGLVFMFVPVFPKLYMHMLAQRRKMLGGNTKSRKAKKGQ